MCNLNSMASNLFLQKFPTEKTVWENNQVRIDGFVEFTKNPVHTFIEPNGSKKTYKIVSIKPEEAEYIKKINNLGFITLDSQVGDIDIDTNPVNTNNNGIKLVEYKLEERAYCEGFIRKELLSLLKDKIKDNPNIMIYDFSTVKKHSVNLTKEQYIYEDGSVKIDKITNARPMSIDKIQETIDTELAGDYRASYTRQEFDPIHLNIDNWALITFIDKTYGHYALDPDGLFNYIQSILKDILESLPNSHGGHRSRTRTRSRYRSKKLKTRKRN